MLLARCGLKEITSLHSTVTKWNCHAVLSCCLVMLACHVGLSWCVGQFNFLGWGGEVKDYTSKCSWGSVLTISGQLSNSTVCISVTFWLPYLSQYLPAWIIYTSCPVNRQYENVVWFTMVWRLLKHYLWQLQSTLILPAKAVTIWFIMGEITR